MSTSSFPLLSSPSPSSSIVAGSSSLVAGGCSGVGGGVGDRGRVTGELVDSLWVGVVDPRDDPLPPALPPVLG